jgi:hypothetical protein
MPAAPEAATPERVGWWQAFCAVAAGSIIVGVGFLGLLFVLDSLHLVPYAFDDTPGRGWPWRIDGAWALVADLGPMLAVSFAFAGVTNWYLTERNGVHARRCPLALVASAVGWLPLTGNEHGLVVVSGGGAFCIAVIAARAISATERRPMPWSRPLLAALLAGTFALGLVSVAYGMLHPMAATNATYPPSAKLRDGRSERLDFILQNRGPAAVRVARVTLADSPGLRLARVQIGGERLARLRDLRFKPRTFEPGDEVSLFVQLSRPACRHPSSGALMTLRAFDVRMNVAGSHRTQRVVLDKPLRVSCGDA